MTNSWGQGPQVAKNRSVGLGLQFLCYQIPPWQATVDRRHRVPCAGENEIEEEQIFTHCRKS